MEVGIKPIQVPEALEHVAARAAHDVPLHVEEPDVGGVEEKIDAFRLCKGMRRRVTDRIDPEEIEVGAGDDQVPQTRHDAG